MRLAAIILIILLSLAGAPRPGLGQSVPAAPVLVLAGPEGGTYLSMVQDLERLFAGEARSAGLQLVPVPTGGALYNAVSVARHPTIPLALTQGDVGYYLTLFAREATDAKRALDGLRVVLPLHLEEVQLVARRGIDEIGDLAGRRVAIGEPGSGTQVTAIVLLSLLKIEPREIPTMPTDAALRALQRGDLDAVFLVAGVPTPVLQAVPAAAALQLVPITLATVPPAELPFPHYQAQQIPGGTYAWQPRTVSTVALRSVLATMADQPCDVVQRVVRGIVDHGAWLRQRGHPAWKDPGAADPALLARWRDDPVIARIVSPCVAPLLRP